MDKASGDITKITLACTAAQENICKLIENVVSQALPKPQELHPLTPQQIPEVIRCQIPLMKQSGPHPGQ